MANILQMVIAHVVDAKDKTVLVFGHGIADFLEELVLLFAALFVDLGHMNDLCAPRLGHDGRLIPLSDGFTKITMIDSRISQCDLRAEFGG